MRRHRVNTSAVFLAFLVLLSGCVADEGAPGQDGGKSADKTPSPPDANPSSEPRQTPPTGPLRIALNETMILEGCNYWYGQISLPPGMNPGRPPEGFTEPDRPLATRIALLRFECQRIAVQDLDRGPAALVLELHSNVKPLEECRVRVPGMTYWVAQTVLVEDVDVANRTKNVGLTTYEANIGSMGAPSGIELLADGWVVDGNPASEFQVLRDDYTSRYDMDPMRLFWYDGASMWTGDLEMTGASSDFAPRVVVGNPASPLLMAEAASEVALDSFWYEEGSATLRIQQHPSGSCAA